MRWAIILLTTALLQVSFVVQSQTVSFSGRNVSLKKVFEVIKSQTGNFFFYDVFLLKDAKPVTVQLKNTPLETALNEIFKNQPVTWVLEHKTITIIKKQPPATPAHAPPAPMAKPLMQVKGTVTDEEGYPISYASVVVKGIKRGKFTDINGSYLIQANQGDVLLFSSVSYTGKQIKVTGPGMNVTLQKEVMPMEALVVGGDMAAVKRKSDATSVTVLDSKTLENLPVNTLDQVFTGLVPGTSSFDVGDRPEGFPSLTIRGAAGANSLSTISVYVDGIEYAGGSGYLFQLDKTNIDRIEVVRGPGASTMYGAGSNGGIVQIFTKKGKPGRTSLNLTTGAGFYKSKWVRHDPFQQMHNLEFMSGDKNVAITLGASYRTVGAYLPDGGEKNKGLYAGAKFNFGKLQGNLIGRYNDRSFSYSRTPSYDTAMNPRTDIILEPSPGLLVPAYEWLDVKPRPSVNKRGLTETSILGINLSHRTTANWMNNLEAGYTSNSTAELPVVDGTIPLQRKYYASKERVTTIRYSNVLRLKKYGGVDATISSGAVYKKYSPGYPIANATAAATLVSKDPGNENYGVFVQANPSYKNVYLTVGMRYEKNNFFDAAWNPRVGLTTNFERQSVIVKPRVSWGRGTTSPSYRDRFGIEPNMFAVLYGNPAIKPQTQEGFDYGLEIYEKKGRYKFEVIRYDNVIRDMISQVNLGPDTLNENITAFTAANVAAVANNGWEFSGEYRVRRFTLLASYSIMNSIVKDSTGTATIPSLRGKAPGARLGHLPKHTAGFNLAYNFFKLFAKNDNGNLSILLTEMDGVKSDDYVKYVTDIAYGRIPYIAGQPAPPVETSPVFRLGLSADYFITNRLRFFVQGSNILNNYKFEYDSNYPTHGATWLFGFKYNLTEHN